MDVQNEYVRQALEIILKIDPSLSECKEDVEQLIIDRFNDKMTNPTIQMENNTNHGNVHISLTQLCNWIDTKKPVVSGNGTFYMQPDVLRSPTSIMLKTLKMDRKLIKRKMFSYKPGDDLYQQLDLSQLNAKIIMNAEYGASGTLFSAFYNKFSPPATTMMAQSIITTMAAFFEGFIGDNHKFFHINECMEWMEIIRKKDRAIHKWIVKPSLDETIIRIKNHFHIYDVSDDAVIEGYLTHCTERELTYIFYANNLNDIISRHPTIIDILRNILISLPLYQAATKEVPAEFRDKFSTVDDYNKWMSSEMFLNPYNVPNNIEPYMTKLSELLNQYCLVDYITPDSIVKLNNHKRNTVLLVDTDSNVINSNIFVEFILKDIFHGETFSRDSGYNEMICVNILDNVIDYGVKRILDIYGERHNMDLESRQEFVMKNEYLFKRFFLMDTKKRYVTSIALREGNIMSPMKIDIKGLDFIKAGVTDEVTERFTKILQDNILLPDDIDLHSMMRDLKQFEKEIRSDLRRGGTGFLKQHAYKSENAYKIVHSKKESRDVSMAWSTPVFRASAIWNELYPLQKINYLDRVKILKTTITSIDDLDVIKERYPEEYNRIIIKVFGSDNEEIRKAGLKIIAIPSAINEIPEWVINFIDYDVSVSDVIASFRSVLEALKIEGIRVKTSNGKANIISSLISI